MDESIGKIHGQCLQSLARNSTLNARRPRPAGSASAMVRSGQSEISQPPMNTNGRQYHPLKSLMSLLIKNATIVTADEIFIGDLLAVAGVIKEIGAGLSSPDAEVIDATGKYLFPGFIDPHVHIYLPFHGDCLERRLRLREQGRADGRNHHAHRDVLPRPQTRTPSKPSVYGKVTPPGSRRATTPFTWA